MSGLGNLNRPNVVSSTQGIVCRTEKKTGKHVAQASPIKLTRKLRTGWSSRGWLHGVREACKLKARLGCVRAEVWRGSMLCNPAKLVQIRGGCGDPGLGVFERTCAEFVFRGW